MQTAPVKAPYYFYPDGIYEVALRLVMIRVYGFCRKTVLKFSCLIQG
jgi:hypothetical protein